MKRDMDLVRLILLKIENEYQSTGLCNLRIEGYKPEVVAYHCKILNEKGLVSSYKAQYADGNLYFFSVGSLTWDGCDYLERIRDNSQWTKVKGIIQEKGLPLVIETVKDISSALLAAATEGTIKALIR